MVGRVVDDVGRGAPPVALEVGGLRRAVHEADIMRPGELSGDVVEPACFGDAVIIGECDHGGTKSFRDGNADVAGSGESDGRMSIAEKFRLVNESLQRMVTLPAGLVHDDDSERNSGILQNRVHGMGNHGRAVSRANDDGSLLED
jgi:hypothetical protein